MKLADNFTELLLEMEKQAFIVPVYDEDGDWCLSSGTIKYPYWRDMFLFEELDFDKAIAIYSDKDFLSVWELKQIEDTKQYLKERNFIWCDDLGECMKNSQVKYFSAEKFVRNLRSNMVYRKKDAGREKADKMLKEYWYSQPDYQQVEKAMRKVNLMIDYWTMQRKCIEWKAEHQARYQSLVGTPATD
jgi:hypothetical protein